MPARFLLNVGTLLAVVILAPPGAPAQAPVVVPLADVVPGASVGEFSFGTKVHACYVGATLVDIGLRSVPFTLKCTRTANLVHAGIDLPAVKGTAIHPIADGIVSDVVQGEADPSWRALGYAVFLRHAGPRAGQWTYSAYFHLASPPNVAVGRRVKAGKTVIGHVGATGAAFGPHLHLEVRNFATRLFPTWANIYGAEGTAGDGPTTVTRDLADNWLDPVEFVKAAAVLPARPITVVETPAPAAAPDTPDGAVRGFYAACMAGRVRDAEAMLADALRGPMKAAGTITRFCDESTRNKSLSGIEVLSQAPSRDKVVVVARLSFQGGGTLDRDTTYVVRESGAWRITSGTPSSPQTFAERLSAARRGDAASQVAVGVAYATGNGVARSGTEAVRWLELAAAGSGTLGAVAAGWLGAIYRNGMGVSKDAALAVRWFSRGAELGSGAAAQNLAELYDEGKLVRKDAKLAESWYAKAAALYEIEAGGGDVLSTYRLGRLYAFGRGVRLDTVRADSLLASAARGGNADAATLRSEMTARSPATRSQTVAGDSPRVGRDPLSGGTITLAQDCPDTWGAFFMTSQGVGFRIRVDLPDADFLLDNAQVPALIGRAVKHAEGACSQKLTITRADIVVYAPGYPSDSAPAAKGTFDARLQTRFMTGRANAISHKNFVLAKVNWAKLRQSGAIDTVLTVDAIAANPFISGAKVIAVWVEFEAMETASIGFFTAPMNEDAREMNAVLKLKVPRIAIDGIPAAQFIRAGQRAVIVGVVRGRADKAISEDRIPLVSLRVMHLCTDADCSDM